MPALTRCQADAVRGVAADPRAVCLFEGDSLSGISRTVRVRREWLDEYYQILRYSTTHVFGVAIRSDADHARFERKLAEAKALWNEIRHA